MFCIFVPFVGTTLIQVLNNCWFLRVVLCQYLLWERRIGNLRNSRSRAIDVIQNVAHNTRGTLRVRLLFFYCSFICSNLAYGCEVYSSAAEFFLRFLDLSHRAGIILATGAFPIPHVDILLWDVRKPLLGLCRVNLIIPNKSVDGVI